MIKPAPLKKGDTIAIIAPSHWMSNESLQKTKTVFNDLGYNVLIHPQTSLRHHQSAGTHDERVNAIHDVFKNPDIKAIITAMGGHRAMHLLDKIDYELIKKNPKIFIGYSDTTALLNAFNAQADLVTFHGANGYKLSTHPDAHMLQSLVQLITGDDHYTLPMEQSKTLNEGSAIGELVGGNLCLLSYLVRTDYMPSLKGKILFIEDTLETYRNIDRMLWLLKQSGKLADCAGILIGDLNADPDDELSNGGIPFGHSVEDMVKEHTAGLDIPIVINAPFGHRDTLYALPLGIKGELTASMNNGNQFKLIEPAVG